MGKMVPNHEMEWFFFHVSRSFSYKMFIGNRWFDNVLLTFFERISDWAAQSCTVMIAVPIALQLEIITHPWGQIRSICGIKQIESGSKHKYPQHQKNIYCIYILKHTYCIQLEPLTLSDIAAYVYILYNYYISIYIYIILGSNPINRMVLAAILVMMVMLILLMRMNSFKPEQVFTHHKPSWALHKEIYVSWRILVPKPVPTISNPRTQMHIT